MYTVAGGTNKRGRSRTSATSPGGSCMVVIVQTVTGENGYKYYSTYRNRAAVTRRCGVRRIQVAPYIMCTRHGTVMLRLAEQQITNTRIRNIIAVATSNRHHALLLSSSILTQKPSWRPTQNSWKRKSLWNTYTDIHRKVAADHRLLYTLSTRGGCPGGGCKCLHIFCKGNRRENLKQADEEVRDFIVRKLPRCQTIQRCVRKWIIYLLTKADSWASIERDKDEGVRSHVLVHPLIEEPIWVKFLRCENKDKHKPQDTTIAFSPSGPQRSFLRCMRKTEYCTLQYLVSVSYKKWLTSRASPCVCRYINGLAALGSRQNHWSVGGSRDKYVQTIMLSSKG